MTPARIIDKIRVALHRPRNAAIAICLALVGALGAGWFVGYVGGVIDGKYKIGIYKQAERVEYKLFGGAIGKRSAAEKARQWASQERRIETTFLNLETTTAIVETSRPGRGGGMTEVGGEVLLLTFDGLFFAVSGPDAIARPNITPPDNGYAAYAAAAVGRFANLQHNPEMMRYNDVLHYRNDAGHGLIISYTEWVDAEDCYRSSVAQLPLEASQQRIADINADADDWRIIYQTKPCLPLKTDGRALAGLTAGGRMAFKAPNTLIFASGDYTWDGFQSDFAIAQRPDYEYGKIIEIDLGTGAARTLTSGHRNPQGIAFDANGDLWEVEHGERGGDELNLIIEGQDYGWPTTTLGTRYSGLPIPGVANYGRHVGFASPAYAWVPSIAISSLELISDFDDAWNGDLLLASLQSQSLFRIRLRDRRVEFVEPIPIGQRIRYALPLSDGRIVLWTDNSQLVFVEKGAADMTAVVIEDHIAGLDATPAMKARITSAVEQCQQCHSFGPDAHSGAPALGAVAGKKIGSAKFAGYSDSLADVDGIWDRETLIAFIDNPSSVAAGTIMPDPGIDDPEVQAALADLLIMLSEKK